MNRRVINLPEQSGLSLVFPINYDFLELGFLAWLAQDDALHVAHHLVVDHELRVEGRQTLCLFEVLNRLREPLNKM